MSKAKPNAIPAPVGFRTSTQPTQDKKRVKYAVLDAINHNTYRPFSRWVILFSLVVMLLGSGVLYVLFTIPVGSSTALIE
ncbi:MAG: hypothetical protein HC840_23125 [Leptolyngbyaceae cyanobacterium RM2_2_4]|nr:hypothetical protein [Leptolyngbyaceae cyanobacterium SM1_4_3]NJO51824.1 hypothetical protein [Leptolyngbyaceae cyanobacterium RM2_2_4]